MAIYLAPIEGLLDFVLRDILTRVGGVDRCVSEFIRITHTLMSERAFLRTVPELAQGGKTLCGVPVWAQLLGSDPVCLADNAARLAGMGPAGIDLNFGCPAKVVNRHGGGAALLVDPDVLYRIAAAVRAAVPQPMPVTAKMRLGFHDDRLAEACAQALEAGGVAELVVHGRTKADGYRPPAYWDRIADVRRAVSIPVVANGEIWTVQDALRCRSESGCESVMLGRGMVSNPGLARELRSALGGGQSQAAALSWEQLQPLIAAFWHIVCTQLERKQQAGRLKQWLNLLRRHYPQAEHAYQAVRTLDAPADVSRWLVQAACSP